MHYRFLKVFSVLILNLFVDSNSRHNLLDYSKIFEFKNPSNQLMNEWNTYCQMEENLQMELNLDQYWKNKSQLLPTLFKKSFNLYLDSCFWCRRRAFILKL
jgi:hypothetical protein